MIDWREWSNRGQLSRSPVEVIEHALTHGVSYEVAAWEMAVLAEDNEVDELLDRAKGEEECSL